MRLCLTILGKQAVKGFFQQCRITVSGNSEPQKQPQGKQPEKPHRHDDKQGNGHKVHNGHCQRQRQEIDTANGSITQCAKGRTVEM